MKTLLAICLLWFAVLTAPATTFSPSSVTFSAVAGSTPAPQDVVVSTTGSVTWSANDTSPWFDAHPTSGASGTLIHITFPFNLSGYSPGTYVQLIHFTATGNPAKDLTVTMVLTSGQPSPTATARATATATAVPHATATASATATATTAPSPIPNPQGKIRLAWLNLWDPTLLYVRIYDDQGQGPRFIYQIRASSSSPSNTPQQATLISAIPGTNMIPGSHHIYFVKSVDFRGRESDYSNMLPYTFPP